MASDRRSLEILIKARDLASAEFAKTQDWLNSLSGTSVKTTDTVAKGFKVGVLTSIRDSVKELKAFVGAFSLLAIGRNLVRFAEEWLDVRKKTREAREEFELYLNLTGSKGGQRQSLLDLRESLKTGGSGSLTEQQQTAIAILADKFRIVRGEAAQLAKDAELLASRLSAFKGDPVAAFEALAKAQAGVSDELVKKLGVQEKSETALIAIRRERLAIEQDMIATQKQAEAISVTSGYAGLSLGSQLAAKELREEAKAAQDLAAQFRDIKGLTTSTDPAGDRARAIRAKADLILIDTQIRNTRAQAQRDAIEAQRTDFRGGLREGFEAFRQEVTDFRDQGYQAVTGLLGGVRDIGLGVVDALVSRTITAREALRKLVEDMLRLLARLAAQIAANQLLAGLFSALLPAANSGTQATIGTGAPGPGPTPGAPGTGASSFGANNGLKQIGDLARNRLEGGGRGGPTNINFNIHALDGDSILRIWPQIRELLRRELVGDRNLQLEIKGAAA